MKLKKNENYTTWRIKEGRQCLKNVSEGMKLKGKENDVT